MYSDLLVTTILLLKDFMLLKVILLKIVDCIATKCQTRLRQHSEQSSGQDVRVRVSVVYILKGNTVNSQVATMSELELALYIF